MGLHIFFTKEKVGEIGMSDTTLDKKMELVQQIRAQYNKNQYDLLSREQILYGRTSNRDIAYEQETVHSAEEIHVSSFKLRMLIAVALAVLVIALDLSGKAFYGITATEIFSTLSEDYEEAIDAWISTQFRE